MSKFKTICLLLIVSLFLSGCWSKRELNELAIVSALGIDKVDDEFDVTVQIVVPGEISSKAPTSGRSPVITHHAKGKTIFEAIRKMTTLSTRKIYFAHTQVVILGDELAKEGIGEALDLISRDHEFRNDFDVIIAHEATAKDVLNVLTPVEKVPANKIINSLRTSQKAWGSTISINIDELVSTLSSNEKSPLIPAIEIQGDAALGMSKANINKVETPVILKYAGLAVFKGDKYVGLLTDKESQSVSFLSDKIQSTIEIIACPKGGTIATEITKSKTKIKGKFEKDAPKINVHIEVEQNVGEVECKINLTSHKNIDYVNKKTEELIKKRIEKTITTIQQTYRADIFGFGEELHRADPKKWKKIKNDWPTIFQDLPVNVEVHVRTKGLGTMQNSFLNKKKKE